MRLLTKNFTADSATIITASSQNVYFPVSNLKHEFRSKVWRSKGTFIINSTNNKLNFMDTDTELTATIASGSYSVTGLQSEIKAQLEAVGVGVYSVLFSEGTGLWTISSDQAEIKLLNSTGTNVSTSILTVLGFSAADFTGGVTYTGSQIAIHTKERIVFDMRTTEELDSVVLMWPKEDGIKLSNSAVVKIEANATDNWSSPSVSQTLTINNDFSLASHYFSTSQTYRYWSITIEDSTNPYLYVELGVCFIGKALAIQEPENGFNFDIMDRSSVSRTSYGNEYIDEYPKYAILKFEYKYMQYEDVKALELVYQQVGRNKPIFVTLDHTDILFDKDNYAIYGKLGNSLRLSHAIYNLLGTNLILTEIA